MPGRDYVASIRDFWRVCSGCDARPAPASRASCASVLNTEQYELTVMDRPIESETAKIVENSYRATILAFLNEWSIFAERNGVDLLKVVAAIKKRPTHDNMIFPGPGIGGYCLPKDGGLGYWAYKHILGFEDGDQVFRMSTAAIDINDTRALHVATLTRDALRNMGRYIAGAEVLICGASYRQDVGDTRYSGSEIIVRKLTEMGAEMRVHDPYVEHWYEFEKQDDLPGAGALTVALLPQPGPPHGAARASGPGEAMAGVQALILAVPHAPYLELSTGRRGLVGRPAARRGRLLRHPQRRRRSGATWSSAARSRAWAAATSSGSRKRCALTPGSARRLAWARRRIARRSAVFRVPRPPGLCPCCQTFPSPTAARR